MNNFLIRFQQSIQNLGLAGSSVVIAVSGGADSVALAHAFSTIQKEESLSLVIAHFNHQWRGEASEQDLQWVSELAQALNIPFHSGSAEPLNSTEGRNSQKAPQSEETARELRYRFLHQTALQLESPHIALGHTSDDNVETILFHLLRGTGLRGLRGIPFTRSLDEEVTLVRPLLDVSRSEIEEWLHSRNHSYLVDPSNENLKYSRNRIRHELLPLLEQNYHADVKENVLSLAHQVIETHECLVFSARKLLEESLLQRGNARWELNSNVLLKYPRHLIRETFVLIWMEQNWPRKKMRFDHWDALANVVFQGGSIMVAGSVLARKRKEIIILEKQSTTD